MSAEFEQKLDEIYRDMAPKCLGFLYPFTGKEFLDRAAKAAFAEAARMLREEALWATQRADDFSDDESKQFYWQGAAYARRHDADRFEAMSKGETTLSSQRSIALQDAADVADKFAVMYTELPRQICNQIAKDIRKLDKTI